VSRSGKGSFGGRGREPEDSTLRIETSREGKPAPVVFWSVEGVYGERKKGEQPVSLTGNDRDFCEVRKKGEEKTKAEVTAFSGGNPEK